MVVVVININARGDGGYSVRGTLSEQIGRASRRLVDNDY